MTHLLRWLCVIFTRACWLCLKLIFFLSKLSKFSLKTSKLISCIATNIPIETKKNNSLVEVVLLHRQPQVAPEINSHSCYFSFCSIVATHNIRWNYIFIQIRKYHSLVDSAVRFLQQVAAEIDEFLLEKWCETFTKKKFFHISRILISIYWTWFFIAW